MIKPPKIGGDIMDLNTAMFVLALITLVVQIIDLAIKK